MFIENMIQSEEYFYNLTTKQKKNGRQSGCAWVCLKIFPVVCWKNSYTFVCPTWEQNSWFFLDIEQLQASIIWKILSIYSSISYRTSIFSMAHYEVITVTKIIYPFWCPKWIDRLSRNWQFSMFTRAMNTTIIYKWILPLFSIRSTSVNGPWLCKRTVE